MCLRKLCLLVLKPLIFYSDYLRQVVACGSKSVTGRDFNADMKSEISWKLIVIKKIYFSEKKLLFLFRVEDLQTTETVA